jgi:hypothetical protein
MMRFSSPALALLTLAACETVSSGQVSPCQIYQPQVAKRTFDGRVGVVLVQNAGSKVAQVRVYHPDGQGEDFRHWTVGPGKVLALTGDDGARLTLGNDWGIQVDRSCVSTLGQAGEWQEGEFSLHWDGDSLGAGLARRP